MARNLKSGILITGDASGAVKATKLTREEMQKLNATTKKASKSAKEQNETLGEMSKIAATSAKALASLGAAGSAALVAIINSSTNAAKEIQVLSRLAGVSAEEFQTMAHAASTVGVETDKFADIMKDVQDKVGDFLQNGGGPMKDFFDNIAPAVGVTAEQFKNLSGPQALELYVSSLEKANLSQSEMTFYMEAIASDATLLLPLMRDNASAFKELGSQAKDAGLYLNQIEVESLADLDSTFLEIGQTLSTLTNIIGAELEPYISAIAGSFLDASKEAGGFRDEIAEMVRSLATGVGFLFDWGRGIRVAAKAFKALGVTIYHWVLDAGDRIELLGLDLKRMFVASGAAGEKFGREVSKVFVDMANELIAAYNAIPLLSDVEPITFTPPDTGPFEAALTQIDSQMEEIKNGIEKRASESLDAWAEFFDLMAKPLPSEEFNRRLNEMLDNAKRKTGETGKAISENLDLSQDFSFSMDSMLTEFNSTTDEIVKQSEDSSKAMQGAFSESISIMTRDLGEFSAAANTILNGLVSGELNSLAGLITAGGTAALPAYAGGLYSKIQDGSHTDLRQALDMALPGFFLGTIGDALGLTFGGGPSDRTQGIQFSGGNLSQSGFTGEKFSQENRDAVDAAGAVIRELSKAIEEETGQALQTVVDLAVGSRDGIDLILNGQTVLNNYKGELVTAVDLVFEDMLSQVGETTTKYELLANENESLVDTYIRVNAQIDAVTSAAETMGLSFDPVRSELSNVADFGLIAADALVEAVGGLDAFVQGTSFFYNNFFSEQERFNNSLKEFTSTMTLAGVELPKTRQEFKDLVLGLDLVNTADQELYATLIKLAPTANLVYTELEETNSKLTDTGSILVNMEDPIETVNTALENTGTTADTTADSLGTLIDAENELTEIRINNLDTILAETQRHMSEFRSSLVDPTGGSDGLGLIDRTAFNESLAVFLSGGFAQSLEEVTEAVQEVVDTTHLEITLLRLQGRESEALAKQREHELSQVTEAEAAILKLIYAQEDLNEANEQAANLAAAEEKRVTSLNSLIQGFANNLARSGLTDLEKSLFDLDLSIAEAVTKASELGATEDQLSIIRQYGAEQTNAITQAEADRLEAIAKANADQAAADKETLDLLVGDFAQRFLRLAMDPLDIALYDLHQEVVLAMEAARELGATEAQLSVFRDYEARQREALINDAEQAATALNEVSESLEDLAGAALDRLKQSVSAEQEQLKAQFDSDIDNINANYSNILDTLKSNLDGVNDRVRSLTTLTGQLDNALNANSTPSLQSRQRAQAQLFSALNGGNLAGLDLSGAIGAVSQPSAGLFGSFNDYLHDFNVTNNALSGLRTKAGAELSAEQNVISLLQSQIEQTEDQHETELEIRARYFDVETEKLTAIVETAQEQLDAIKGVDNSILSLSEAIAGFSSAVQQHRAPAQAIGEISVSHASRPNATSEQVETKQLLKTMNRHMAKTAKVLSKFDYDGMPGERVTT